MKSSGNGIKVTSRRNNGVTGDLLEMVEEGPIAQLNGRPSGHKRSLTSEIPNIALLLVLYTLQGIPLGLSGSIPFLLQDKVTYSQQALFSLVSLPFSLKLLWAPLVDSVFYSPFGRRKSWLVPVQLICGLMMLGAGSLMDDWVGEDGGEPHMVTLTLYFMTLYFAMATQDIAVDGWALTMLSHGNVGYASTCNTVGQTVGFFVSQVGFLALNDAAVCNKYLRSEPSDVGLVTLSSFLCFWGVVFLVTTAFVCFFKAEVPLDSETDLLGLTDTYKQLIKCAQLPALQTLGLVLLTCRIAFAVTDAATSLKLVEYGLPKEEIVMLSPLLVASGVLIPIAVGRLTAGPRPMGVFLWGYLLRVVVTVVYSWTLLLARSTHMLPGARSTMFYVWLIGGVILHEVASNFMFVSQMAFFSRISDPAIGGTYMTLLNTLANVGYKWPNSLSLALLDQTTLKDCVDREGEVLATVGCSTTVQEEACNEAGASCVVAVDGYYVQVCRGQFLVQELSQLVHLFIQQLGPGFIQYQDFVVLYVNDSSFTFEKKTACAALGVFYHLVARRWLCRILNGRSLQMSNRSNPLCESLSN
ncbi:unnamed protein product [Discosporangium mesarthrocarpum]